jgi:hypothetical protein
VKAGALAVRVAEVVVLGSEVTEVLDAVVVVAVLLVLALVEAGAGALETETVLVVLPQPAQAKMASTSSVQLKLTARISTRRKPIAVRYSLRTRRLLPTLALLS